MHQRSHQVHRGGHPPAEIFSTGNEPGVRLCSGDEADAPSTVEAEPSAVVDDLAAVQLLGASGHSAL